MKKKLKRKRLILLNFYEESIFLNNLKKIGYPKIAQKKNDIKKKFIIEAFQRRFRPKLINGSPDQECLIITNNLIKS